MRKMLTAALAAAIAAFCAMGVLSEGESARPVPSGDARNVIWGGFQALRAREGRPSFYVVDMRRCFECERKTMGRNPDPFRFSFPAPGSVESFYNHWLAVQLEIVEEKGWKLEGIQGDRFIFSIKRPEPSMPLDWMKRLGITSERLRNVPAFPGADAVVVVPNHLTCRGRRGNRQPVECDYSGYYLVVPPGACSLRVYLPSPCDPDSIYFEPGWMNVPEVRSFLMKVRNDKDSLNVIRIDFERGKFQERFWRWLPLKFVVGCRSLRNGAAWAGWEFLDRKGDPLSTDYPMPVRFFPEGFDDAFVPAPLKGG